MTRKGLLNQQSLAHGKIAMRILLLIMMLNLAGCATMDPPAEKLSLDRIHAEMKQASVASPVKTEVPDAISSSLLPPLKIAVPKPSGKQLEQRFDLVINDAPVNQVYMGIVSGTHYSMLLHPDIKGSISVSLKDVTLFEALESLRELYGYEYKLDGNRIYILKPGLQARIYKVNYIVGIRRGRSDISVTSGASGQSGSANAGASTQTQASSISSVERGDFWGEIEDAVRSTLDCKIPTQGGGAAPVAGSGSGAATTQSRGTAAGSNEPQYGSRERGGDGCAGGRSVLVNQMTGAIFVRAMPEELRTVESLLQAMQVSIDRQVILEAKIIDVQLNSGAQQGINWGVFNDQGLHLASLGANPNAITTGTNGGSVAGATLGSVLGTGIVGVAGSAASSGMGMALQVRNFSALLNFLQTQGTVNVLSSPRISTINNQKAVLKVGTDEQYVTGFDSSSSSSISATAGTTVSTQPTPTYSTFFSGISLDITPQIDEDGMITLHVHPLVSQVTEVMKMTINNMSLPFASNKISETDSVVKVKDGQIVVIGGLMTESSSDNRSKVPGVGDVPVLGSFFRKGGQASSKRELVIMIKPTVVTGDNAWVEDIAATQRRIGDMDDGAPKGKR